MNIPVSQLIETLKQLEPPPNNGLVRRLVIFNNSDGGISKVAGELRSPLSTNINELTVRSVANYKSGENEPLFVWKLNFKP